MDSPVVADKNWHLLTAEDALSTLQSHPERGLDTAIQAQRLRQIGKNELPEGKRRSLLRMFADQFADVMIAVLIVAALISGLLGEAIDTIVILVIVVLNAVIGAFQEYRAERAMAALRQMATPTAQVRRNGRLQTVPALELVPGDIVLMEAGNVIPADLRLIESVNFQVNEAALTGESQAVEKHTDALRGGETFVLGDRRNMAYKGTLVTRGRATGLVVTTGLATELGKIARLLQQAQNGGKTPLQKRLARFGRRLAAAIMMICVILFVTGLARGEPLMLMFLTAVSLAVAAVPEALPAVVTMNLALGARVMSRRHSLIRRLPAVETLGSVTYICADKTGTLTQNKMHVDALVLNAERLAALPGRVERQSPLHLMALAMAMNNDVARDEDGELQGDPTEVALYVCAEDAGFDKTQWALDYPRVGERPFDADRKLMTTFHQQDSAVIAFTKGAPEQLLERCQYHHTATGVVALSHDAVAAEADSLAAEGYRVLGIAYRRWKSLPDAVDRDDVEQGLIFLGLAALIDPPRPEAAAAVAECLTAGITPVMITGDHPSTARAIAERLGFIGNGDDVISGRELARLSPQALDVRLEHARVFARVTPEQKILIVEALQKKGEFAAMTGDGVNDAPALKRADIGVAMGKRGTDVAREAADMVQLDDNFATIVAAVREGRRIFDNIRKFIKYTMTSNSGEVWTLALAPFLGLPIPLLPIHILWINLVTDGLPGLALAVEKEERGIMHRPPRPPNESIFAHGMWQHMIWVGLLIGGLSLSTQAYAIAIGSEHWQTMVFTVLTLSQLVHAMVIRSERQSLFTLGFFSNKALLGAVLLTVLLQLGVIYLPAANAIFKTQQLTGSELLFCFALPMVVFVAVECEKWLVRRERIYTSHERADSIKSN